jgi:hypothetical protein
MRTGLLIRQYVLCGFLALGINTFIPGLIEAYSLNWNRKLVWLLSYLFTYPFLVLLWSRVVAKHSKAQGANFGWFFLGYLINFIPVLLIILAFKMADL